MSSVLKVPMVIWLTSYSILSVIIPILTAPKSWNTYHITYVSSSFLVRVGVWFLVVSFFSPTETFRFTSRIGSWPVEVLNPNIYQYAINAFKSSFLQLWKRHCSHLTLKILKTLGLSPEFYVQERYFWRLFN